MELLEQRDVNVEVIQYLETPPQRRGTRAFVVQIGHGTSRSNEKRRKTYKDLNLEEDTKTRADLIEAMVKNPILIERAIVVNHEKVALGRPPENVLGIL